MSAKRKDNNGRVLRQGESQRKDGTYMYRYTNLFKKRVTVYAKTLQELREKEKQITINESYIKQAFSPDATVIQLVKRHCETKTGLKESTRNYYNDLVTLISKYPISNLKASTVTVSMAKMWLIELRSEGRAVTSVYTLGRFMNSVYKMAIEDDLLVRNPFSFRMDIFSEGRNYRNALTANEQQQFLEFLDSKPRLQLYRDYTIVLLETGLRIGEFMGLTTADINFQESYISVTKQLKKNRNGTLYIDTPKSKAGVRQIPMTKAAKEAIVRMINRQQLCNITHVVDGVSGFIVTSKHGELYGGNRLSEIYARLNDRFNELQGTQIKITPHVLRHTFCTNMARAGVSPHYVQYLMGHNSSVITADVYTHRTYDDAKADMLRVLELA